MARRVARMAVFMVVVYSQLLARKLSIWMEGDRCERERQPAAS